MDLSTAPAALLLFASAAALRLQPPPSVFPTEAVQRAPQRVGNQYGTPAYVPAPAPAPAPYAPQPFGQVPYPAPAPTYPAPAPAPSYGPAPAPAPSYGPSANSGTTCYKVYKDCAIANVHPFERRSKYTQQECQNLCQSYGNSCQSFVFDNGNRVCDLFAVTGTAYPAAFFKAQGRDYYEKITNCAVATGGAAPSGGYSGGGGGGGGVPSPGPNPATDSCSPRVTRFLRIEGFELSGSDERTVQGSVADCIRDCTADTNCVSFDYAGNECRITSEAAVPTGQGQLVEQTGSEYYEKICLDTQVSTNCPSVFNRVPQFTLVGFAEEVVTANSFEDCLNQCVQARQNLGITCRSGMFYFEVQDENCILNVEDRSTQPALFVEETEDIVDYFETGCSTTTVGGPGEVPYTGASNSAQPYVPPSAARPYSLRRSPTNRVVDQRLNRSLGTASVKRTRGVLGNERRIDATPSNSWTEWTPCDSRFNGNRRRYRSCNKPLLSLCPSQTQECNTSIFASRIRNPSERIVQTPSTVVTIAPPTVTKTRQDDGSSRTTIKVTVKCEPGKCCPIAPGICLVGVVRSAGGAVSWCERPC